MTYLNSSANFICLLLKHHQDKDVYDALLKRDYNSRIKFIWITHGIRITVSNQIENERCAAALNSFFKKQFLKDLAMSIKTTLTNNHIQNNSRCIDFAGHQLPVWFTNQKDEHLAVRNKVGMFDISHGAY